MPKFCSSCASISSGNFFKLDNFLVIFFSQQKIANFHIAECEYGPVCEQGQKADAK